MFIETSAKAGYNVKIKKKYRETNVLNKCYKQIKAMFRKIGHALPGMENNAEDGQKEQCKSTIII